MYRKTSSMKNGRKKNSWMEDYNITVVNIKEEGLMGDKGYGGLLVTDQG